MTIEIPEAVVRSIAEHARAAYPEECCGFLLGRASEPRRVAESRPAKNIAPEDRAQRYVIDPLELLHVDDAARTKSWELIGIYHSHPDHPAAPSEFDRTRAASWYSYLIMRIDGGEPGDITAWLYDERTETFRPEPIVQS